MHKKLKMVAQTQTRVAFIWRCRKFTRPPFPVAYSRAAAATCRSLFERALQNMAPPKTIKEYKAALLRLNVQLPSGTLKLSEYANLYENATAQPPAPLHEVNGERARAAKSPMPRRRSFGNVPLSMQAASSPAEAPRAFTNAPLSQQKPLPSATAVESNTPTYVFASAADEDTTESHSQSAMLNTASRPDSMPSGKRTLLASLLVAIVVASGSAFLLMQPSANSVRIEPPADEAAASLAPQERETFVETTDQQGIDQHEQWPVMQAHAPAQTPGVLRSEAEAQLVQVVVRPEVDQSSEKYEPSLSASISISEIDKGPKQMMEEVEVEERKEILQALQLAESPEDMLTTSSATTASAPPPSLKSSSSSSSVSPSSDGSSLLPGGTVAPLGDEVATSHGVETHSSEGSTASRLAAIMAAILAVLSALADATLSLLSSMTHSEFAQWLGRACLDGLRSVGWTLAVYLWRGGTAAARATLAFAADVAPKVIHQCSQVAPQYTRLLLTTAITRPELVAVGFAVLGVLRFVWHCLMWLRRRREAAAAGAAAEVDAAARWALAELREHAQRWHSVSGSAHPLPPSELRARVPHTILSDRSMWPRVAGRVKADENVLVVPAGYPLGVEGVVAKEEGWVFSPATPLSPMLSPGFSPSGTRRRSVSPARVQ